MSAQEISANFGRLSREQGLSQATVRDIAQDGRGFLWIATQNGLNRYDGNSFVVFYKTERENSLSSDFITALAADPRGFLWVGTAQGLDRYDPVTNDFLHYATAQMGSGIGKVLVSSLLCMEDGTVWVGTRLGGLSRIDGASGKTQRFPVADFPELAGINVITARGKDMIWVGTNTGELLSWDQQTESLISHRIFAALELGPVDIQDVLQDRDGHLWIATTTQGVIYINGASGETFQYRHNPFLINSLADDAVNALLQSKDGSIWFGCSQRGLSKLYDTGGSFENYSNQPFTLSSLSSNRVISLFQDKGGILWVGTSDGLSKLFPQSDNVRHYTNIPYNKNSLSHNRVKALQVDNSDILWIGTYGGGLNALNRMTGSFTHYRNNPENPNSLSNDNVFSILEGSENRLWVATYGGGLNLLDIQRGSFKHFQWSSESTSIPNDFIVNLSAGPNNQLWVSTIVGVGLFDREKLTYKPVDNQPDELDKKFVRLVYGTDKQTWWIGTFAAGLFRYDMEKGVFLQYLNDPGDPGSLADNNVQCLLLAKNARFWVGTTGGLDLMDRATGSFQHFRRNDGLPSNTVNGILEDHKNRLWLSTDNGLCRLDPATMEIVLFGTRNGLQGLEFNSGASFLSDRNELMFGGINGFNIFHPSAMLTNPNPPDVVFTSLKVRNRDVTIPTKDGPTQVLELSHENGGITFEFVALDFAAPEKNSYAFMLEGFDQQWQHVGNRHFASYTNLDPGSYKFKVRAANDDGLWSTSPAQIDLIIIPPFYGQPLFFALVALFILFLLWIWNWNNKRNRQMLSRLVTERTQSLEDSNCQLQETAVHLRQTQRKLLETAHKVGMAEIASDVLHNVGNALNGIMVSANVVDKHIQSLKLNKLRRVSDFLFENRTHLTEFLRQDDRGNKVVEILCRLSEDLESGRAHAREEIRELHERGLEIVSILRSQRKYALGEEFYEEVELPTLLEDVLEIQNARILELSIRVERDFDKIPSIAIPKSKMLNVFNHIIKNSCEAMEMGSRRDERRLKLTFRNRDESVHLEIGDSGRGIKPEHLERVFTSGFSTKNSGGGFGLHHCANSLLEIGGSIRAESGGEGEGATFILEIPTKIERKSCGEIA